MPTPISEMRAPAVAAPMVTNPTCLSLPLPTPRDPRISRGPRVRGGGGPPGPESGDDDTFVFFPIGLTLLELRHGQQLRRLEVRPFHEPDRFRGAGLAVHTRVLPLDRDRSRVADPGERPEHRVEVDVAAAHGNEVPAALGLAELQV